MSVMIVNTEMSERRALVHYRVGGEKKGKRRWQREDGSLTPEGYEHYKEMYGWGKGRKKGKDQSDDKDDKENADKKPSLIDRAKARIEKSAEKNRPETRKEAKEAEKEVTKKVEDTVAKINARAEEQRKAGKEIDAERSKATKELNANSDAEKSLKRADPKVIDAVRAARNMSDEELNQQLDRLRREKQFAELMKERDAREKGPLRAAASKLLQQAAEDLTKKSLTLAVDTVITKAKDKINGKGSFKLSDYKDVDIYSLDSEKLASISQAFQNAANLSQNRWKIDHPGENNDQNNGGKKKNQNNAGNEQRGNQNNETASNRDNNQNNRRENNSNQNDSGNSSNSTRLSKGQKRQIRSMASSGKTAAEIAQQFGVSESYIQQLIQNS